MEPSSGHPHQHDEVKVVPIEKGRLEVSIFEERVPPRFRVHFFNSDGEALPPNPDVVVTIETIRGGSARQTFTFENRDGQYLEANQELPEPHEFDAVLSVAVGEDAHAYDLAFVEHDHGETVPGHDHGPHGHTHGIVDPSLASNERGMWALKWSFAGLGVTSLVQLAVVLLSGSVALLADTIHNVGDAATAIPLGVAFWLARRPATQKYPFGYGRVEDLAGVAIVATILVSALVAGYESIDRLLNPQPLQYLGAVMAAGLMGFVGNEAVAVFRIRVGRQIGSVALIADGYHARTDGFTSLAVVLGAIGVWGGFPLADPLVGLGITALIMGIVWQSARAVFARMLDGVDCGLIEEVRHAAEQVAGVREVNEVRARWVGHRLSVDANIAVDPSLTVGQGHEIAGEVNHELLHHLPTLSWVTIHVDPAEHAGEEHHHIAEHAHDGLAAHTH
ncbi:MAG: cation transporter [Chloroflexi bacterium]|nr:cation transporter [Chloroflexota bacterium]